MNGVFTDLQITKAAQRKRTADIRMRKPLIQKMDHVQPFFWIRRQRKSGDGHYHEPNYYCRHEEEKQMRKLTESGGERHVCD